MKRTGLLLAAMLVIVANLVALSGVWYNRTGPPDAVITLTERELPLVPRGDDDSGIALRLRWHAEETEERGNDPWLDRAKLEKLGFDCPAADVDHDVTQYIQLFVVLEYREDDVEQTDASRLFAVDAGRDPDDLRRLYADRERYIVTPGIVQMRYRPLDAEGEILGGRVQRLLPPSIHVPKDHRALFTGAEAEPSYRVTLRYGRRHEPWILAVE